MALLPSGFVWPPLPHLVGLAIATVTVVVFLFSLTPKVEQRHVFAFTP